MNKARMTWTLPVIAVLLLPNGLSAQWKTPWTYEGKTGAEHWGELDPAYALCNTGKEQSPVDIRNAEKADLPPLRFEYTSGPLKHLINNGYAIRVNYHEDSDSKNYLLVGDTRYQLTQFHFHHPSEEYVDGKPYVMAVHLMHQSSDGKSAGVTVFLRAGKSNPTIQKIWEHMPATKGNEIDVPGVEINPGDLLPTDAAYYTYMGSLTAPPCTEGVTWFVLKNPVDISPQQISAFAKLYPHDVRPIQPLNGRIVKQSR